MYIGLFWVLFVGSLMFLNSVGLGLLALYLAVGVIVTMLLQVVSVRMVLADERKSLPLSMRISWTFRLAASQPVRKPSMVLLWPLLVVFWVTGFVANDYLKRKDNQWNLLLQLRSAAAASAIHENSFVMWARILKADVPALMENNFYYGENRIFAGKGMKAF